MARTSWPHLARTNSEEKEAAVAERYAQNEVKQNYKQIEFDCDFLRVPLRIQSLDAKKLLKNCKLFTISIIIKYLNQMLLILLHGVILVERK